MKDFHLFHHLECAMYEKNPNPIRLNASEQEVFDEAVSHIENLIFGDWKTLKGQIGTKVLFEKELTIDAFKKKQKGKLIIKGKKGRWNRGKELFGYVTGLQSEENNVLLIEVFVNGFAEKKSFYEAYENNPFDFWYSLTDLKVTMRHEFIHAKDPNLSIGTGTILRKYGWLHYVNDPARTEFQAHMAEWYQVTSEIQHVMKNNNKSEFYREVYGSLQRRLCKYRKEDDELDFHSLIEGFLKTDGHDSGLIPIKSYKLTNNKEMIGSSRRKFIGALRNYEYWAHKQLWKPKYEAQMADWWLKNRAFKKGKTAQRPKKPKEKKKLTKSEKEQIFRKLKNNYTDMVSLIFSHFKKKGILDICKATHPKRDTSLSKRKDELLSKREYTILRSEKVIIRSLNHRFRSLK